MVRRREDHDRLRNLGPVSRGWLAEIDIHTREDLERLGAVMTYRILKHQRPEVSLNLLYALHAALLDVPWTDLTQEVRDRLRAEAAGDLTVGPGNPGYAR